MKTPNCVALVVLAVITATVAAAGILGVLVNSKPTASITGKLVYECTYRVGNQVTTVVLPYLCPPTMQFQ